MKKFATAFLLFSLLSSLPAFAQPFSYRKETHQFAEKDGQKLYLDRYWNPETPGDTPCVLFVFGGAFVRGARDVEKYMPYFDYLVRNGFSVVSIDYRLGLQKAVAEQRPDLDYFIGELIRTINDAVEDQFDATRFVIEHARDWNIDAGKIISNGSSAGAVTVLQAEYILNNGLELSGRLPSGFRYAGVMSFAGAIFLPQGELEWASRPAPMLLMHGDADLQVPYGTLSYGPMGFYGAAPIADTLQALNYPFQFVSYEDYGHEIASAPMQDDMETILSFLNHLVLDREELMIRTHVKRIGKTVIENKDFGITDYLKGNYDR